MLHLLPDFGRHLLFVLFLLLASLHDAGVRQGVQDDLKQSELD